MDVLFSFMSAPALRRRLTTGSLSGTLTAIMSGVQPLSSYILLAYNNQDYRNG